MFVEIGSVGKFFRPAVSHVGFLPLNDRLKSSGWYDRMVPVADKLFAAHLADVKKKKKQ